MLQFMAACCGLFDSIFFAVFAQEFFLFILALIILQLMLAVFLMGLGRSTRRAKL